MSTFEGEQDPEGLDHFGAGLGWTPPASAAPPPRRAQPRVRRLDPADPPREDRGPAREPAIEALRETSATAETEPTWEAAQDRGGSSHPDRERRPDPWTAGPPRVDESSDGGPEPGNEREPTPRARGGRGTGRASSAPPRATRAAPPPEGDTGEEPSAVAPRTETLASRGEGGPGGAPADDEPQRRRRRRRRRRGRGRGARADGGSDSPTAGPGVEWAEREAAPPSREEGDPAAFDPDDVPAERDDVQGWPAAHTGVASSTDSPEETVDDLGPTPLDDLSEVTDDEASEAVRAASLARDSDDDLGPGVDEDREAPGEEDAQEGEGAGPAAGDPRRRGRRRGRGRGRGREGRDGRDGREFDLEERRGGGGSGHQAQSDPATYLPLEQSPRADLLAGIETIQTRRDAGGIDLLDRLVSRTGDPELRLVAIRALGEVGHSRGLAPLVRCLEDADEGVVREAARGIGLILYYRDREFYQTDNLAFLVLNYLH